MLTVGIVAEEHQIENTLVTISELSHRTGLEVVIVTSAGESVLAAARNQIDMPTQVKWVLWQPGTGAWNTVFAHARTDWVLCLHPGTHLHRTALDALASFTTAHPHCADLLQGPMSLSPDQQALTHLQPVWHRGRFGIPAPDPHPDTAAITETSIHDLRAFACRADRWPGIHPRLAMNVGPPGYLHKKFQARGGRTLCLPSLRWSTTHDCPEDRGADQFFRYLLCWEDSGQAIEPILDHFTELHGPFWVEQHLAHWHASRGNPFDAFDAMVCINSDEQPDRWNRITARFAALGIADKVERLPATWTPQRYQIGCALSHRRAIEMAHQRGLDNILVFEDDAVFLDGATWVLRYSVRELWKMPWTLFYLGGFYSDQHNPNGDDGTGPGGTHLRHAPGLITAHALAYHRRVFDQLLDELPNTPEAMGEFLDGYGGHIDVYYAETFHDGVYRCNPTIATQESYIHLEHPHLRDQFRTTLNP